MPPKKKQKKQSTYNRILREFTKINKQLPEDRKLSIKERRKIIRENILPNYKDVPAYKLRVKQIKSQILKEYEKIPPKEICDLNYIDPSEFAYVEWHSLDETIRELVPDCIYVKVSAGEYGETKIFNTRNYEYGKNGVRSIVENLRTEADEEPSGTYIFSGYQKLRPRKRNDGSPENYYLDFVLTYIDNNGNEEPFGETEVVKFDLPKSREVRKKKTKVRNVIEEKIKDLKSKKDSRRRAKKTLEKNIKDLALKVKKVDKSKKPSLNMVIQKEKQFEKASKLLDKYYAEGKITKTQYDSSVERLLKQMGIK
jgi:hypothetical protein